MEPVRVDVATPSRPYVITLGDGVLGEVEGAGDALEEVSVFGAGAAEDSDEDDPPSDGGFGRLSFR
jgi:hypothetical protein